MLLAWMTKLEVESLATNQAVGGSNPSGRAKRQRVPIGGPFSFCVFEMRFGHLVRSEASKASRQADQREAHPSGRAKLEKAPLVGAFFC